MSAAAAPTTAPLTVKQGWPAAPAGFSTIGWGPEGSVFFQYAITAANGGYTASASADLDGNTTRQAWAYAKPDNADARVAADGDANCTVADLAADNQVGPCDAGGAAVFGQSEF